LDENGLKGLEEERRLAYVGITRARKRAILSFVANRRLHGSWTATLPSRFLGELPEDCIEWESDRGLYGGAGDRTWAASAGPSTEPERWHTRRMTPGLARAKARGGGGAPLLEIEPVRVQAVGGYETGARIFHRKFGYGSVAAVEGDRLTVDFDKAGRKRIVAGFVVPADRAG